MNKEIKKIVIDDTEYETFTTRNFDRRKKYTPNNPKEIRAFIPGSIREVYVKEGQTVSENQELFILEAMKMRNRVYSPISGKIKGLYIEQDKLVAKHKLLLEFE